MKKYVIYAIVALLLIVSVIIFKKAIISKDPIWEVNAKQLISSFKVFSEKVTIIDDLSKIIPFDWDTLYSFGPYTSEEYIYEVVGYRWEKICSAYSEGMNQIVFLKDDTVVCYLYGYPQEDKIYFDFRGAFVKLTNIDKLSFEMNINDCGIRVLTYKK